MAKQVYHAKRADRAPRHFPALLLFFILLFGFTLFNAVAPKRTTSELENRKLAQLPSFSVKTLLNGQWASGFSTYMQDQVACRDGWIWLESAVNSIGFQKVEEGGILLGRDHWMFTKLFELSDTTTTQLNKNLTAISEFAARYPGRVTFMLAPSASVIYPEALPAAAPMVDENSMLDSIFATVSTTAAPLDLRTTFAAAKDQYLYFKTDHHWTPNGAYLAYQQFCALKGLTPFDRDAHESVTIPDFIGTHYSSTRRWDVQPDEITYYPLDNLMTVYQINGEAQYSALKAEPLINTEKFATRDKYAAFLDGNNGYSVIEGNGEGSILVLKDSYANSFIPYLTANYAKIGVIDFRNFAYGPDSTIEAEGYDQILILYNFQTFIADKNLIYINRPTTLTA